MKEYNACGVMFRRAGKVYDFLTNDLDIKDGDNVVVESDKGEDMAKVCNAPRIISVPDDQVMKPILRIATEEDLKQREQNDKDEPEAAATCKKLIVEAGIDMKLLFAEYTLDRSKITFYFTSEGRIDFRQLVKDLARVFKTRIEMRQIGVRDATKMIGGFGICGRELCCTTFLRRFDNISIKTAKDQNLIMNPNKISGVCGRLMCCLMYEKEQYGEGEEGVGCEGCSSGCGSCGCGTNNSTDDNLIDLNDSLDGLFDYSLDGAYQSNVEKPTVEVVNDKDNNKKFNKFNKFNKDIKDNKDNKDNSLNNSEESNKEVSNNPNKNKYDNKQDSSNSNPDNTDKNLDNDSEKSSNNEESINSNSNNNDSKNKGGSKKNKNKKFKKKNNRFKSNKKK